MFDSLNPLVGEGNVPPAGELCELITGTHRALIEREGELIVLAALWADAHDEHSLPPRGRSRRYGGEDTPEVGEFAAAELGALLGTSTGSAAMLMADALDLRHRLTGLWDRLRAGTVRAWQARKIATATRDLTAEAAVRVDDTLTPHLGTLPWARLHTLLEAAIIDADPDAADQRAQAAAAERFLRAGQANEHGLKLLIAKATAGEVIWFIAMANRIADILAADGDPDPIDIRRSKAIGILAQPALALHLLNTHQNDPDPTGGDPGNARPSDGDDPDADPAAESTTDGDASNVDASNARPSDGADPDTDPAAESTCNGDACNGDACNGDPSNSAGPAREAPPAPATPVPPAMQASQATPAETGTPGLGAQPAAPAEAVETGDPRSPAQPAGPAERNPRGSGNGIRPGADRSQQVPSSAEPPEEPEPPEPPEPPQPPEPAKFRGPVHPPEPPQPPEPVEWTDPERDRHRSVDLRPAGGAGDGIDHRRARPPVTLHIHLTDRTLTGTDGCPQIARMEGAGPLTIGQVQRFLNDTRCQIRIAPVLDPADVAPVDAYEIPQRLRDAVRLRHLADTFPYASATAAGMDLDHTIPYARGGPTSQDNLTPLDRRHHRDKTLGGWGKRQPEPDTCLWRSPNGWIYLTTNQGTLPLGCTPYAHAAWNAARTTEPASVSSGIG